MSWSALMRVRWSPDRPTMTQGRPLALIVTGRPGVFGSGATRTSGRPMSCLWRAEGREGMANPLCEIAVTKQGGPESSKDLRESRVTWIGKSEIAMVDFVKVLAEMEARMTPEERERVRAYREREARFDATRAEIPAVFEDLKLVRPTATIASLPRPGAKRSSAVDDTEEVVHRRSERLIEVRIENRQYGDKSYDVIAFIGGPTGHESYRLDADFIDAMNECDAHPVRAGTWCICAGTAGRYERCTIQVEDLRNYVAAKRPDLFEDVASPRP